MCTCKRPSPIKTISGVCLCSVCQEPLHQSRPSLFGSIFALFLGPSALDGEPAREAHEILREDIFRRALGPEDYESRDARRARDLDPFTW